MSDASHVHHGIDYVELTVTDMDAARRFYAAAFDWSFNEYGPAYTGIRRPGGDGEVGGLSLDAEATPGTAAGTGAPLIILYSHDLDASLARVTDAGGTITSAPFDFPGGRRFHFQDPSGNELAVWSES